MAAAQAGLFDIPEPGPPDLPAIGSRVRVHFNLKARDENGIVIVVGGRRVALVPAITLLRVRFHVSPTGVARIRRNEQRDVIAWAWGEVESIATDPVDASALEEQMTLVRFNPYRAATFTDPDGRPVEYAPRAIFGSVIKEKEPGKPRRYGYAWI